jgi:hypothetical protein
MNNRIQLRNKKLILLLKEFKSNDLDIKATSNQINNLFKTPVNIKCFHDNIVSVSGILQNNRHIKYDYNVYKFIESEKEELLKWLVPWNNYKSKSEDDNVLSSYSIYSIELNKLNSEQIVIKIEADKIQSFEHGDISPFYIRVNIFQNLLGNIEYINKRINNYYKFDDKKDNE